MTLKEKQKLVLNKVDEVLYVGWKEYGVDLRGQVIVKFSNKMTRSAGRVCPALKSMKFSNHFMSIDENFDDFLERTVPHEIAHIYTELYIPGAKSGHSQDFYGCMRRLGVPAHLVSRTHSYKRADLVSWTCSNPECDSKGTLTKKQVSMIRNRTRLRHCSKCKKTLSYADVGESVIKQPEGDKKMPRKQTAAPELAKMLVSGKAPKKSKTSGKKVSAYGTAVDIMCKTPDMDKETLFQKCEKAGIDCESGKGAITTAYSAVRKVVSLLRDNGKMD